MSLSPKELEIVNEALAFAKANRNSIAIKYTSKIIYPTESSPISIFMAGSPGAGKTEASIAIVSLLQHRNEKIVRIDPDDLRSEFSSYNGANSYLFQRAVSILVERIHDKLLHQNQSFILDGTLSNLSVALKNINRSIKRKREVEIFYVYQDPERAWNFVTAREKLEGRKILLKDFLWQYFQAKNVVNIINKYYANKVQITLLDNREFNYNVKFINSNDKIDNFITDKYTYSQLENILSKI